jgi:hypothetical protein
MLALSNFIHDKQKYRLLGRDMAPQDAVAFLVSFRLRTHKCVGQRNNMDDMKGRKTGEQGDNEKNAEVE